MAKEIGNWGKPSGRSPPPRSAADLVRARLEPGEKIVWSSRAARRADPVTTLFEVAFLIVALPILVSAIVNNSDAVPLLATLVGLAIVFVVFRASMMFLPTVYALTNKRVVIFRRFIPLEESFAPADLHFLRVRGGPLRGDIVIRHRRPSRFSLRLVENGETLFGVENPVEVANLIRTTLAPHLEVEPAD